MFIKINYALHIQLKVSITFFVITRFKCLGLYCCAIFKYSKCFFYTFHNFLFFNFCKDTNISLSIIPIHTLLTFFITVR